MMRSLCQFIRCVLNTPFLTKFYEVFRLVYTYDICFQHFIAGIRDVIMLYTMNLCDNIFILEIGNMPRYVIG